MLSGSSVPTWRGISSMIWAGRERGRVESDKSHLSNFGMPFDDSFFCNVPMLTFLLDCHVK